MAGTPRLPEPRGGEGDRGRLDFDFVPVNLLVDFRPPDLWDNRLVCFKAPG